MHQWCLVCSNGFGAERKPPEHLSRPVCSNQMTNSASQEPILISSTELWQSSQELVSPLDTLWAHSSFWSWWAPKWAQLDGEQSSSHGHGSVCSHGSSAGVLVAGGEGEWTGVGGGCQFSPSAMQDHVLVACELAGSSFPWGLAQLLTSAPAALSSQAPKPLSAPQRGECEMSSDRSLQELHTRKWVKAAAKSIITKCLFSLYFQDKIEKTSRIRAKAVKQL